MTNTSKAFLIVNRITCSVLGIFEAASEDDAVEAYARDAGYRDCAHEAEVLDSTVEKLRDELRVTEVDLAATVTALAGSMVVHDRDSSDCDAVRDDADAGGSCGWDADGVLAAAEAADVDDALAAAVWEQYPHLVREAYAKAWRAAVELDLAARDDDAA